MTLKTYEDGSELDTKTLLIGITACAALAVVGAQIVIQKDRWTERRIIKKARKEFVKQVEMQGLNA